MKTSLLTTAPAESPAQRQQAMLLSALVPLRPYLDDPAVIEIMRNPDGQVWIEKAGQSPVVQETILTDQATEFIIRLLAPLANTVVSYENPSFTATLPLWQCRVQADIPPVVTAPTLTLRKPAQAVFTLEDYVDRGIMTPRQQQCLVSAVTARKNIVVSGGTGTGKTTLTNALLALLNESSERLVVIEDTRELQCTAPNQVALYTYAHYSLTQAIADSLRRRPDRIIIGEVRDGAALALLKAWNTGHPGGIATVHANSEQLTLERLCEMIEEVQTSANRAFVARSVDMIVHIQRDPSHPAGRCVSGLVEVNGLSEAGDWQFKSID